MSQNLRRGRAEIRRRREGALARHMGYHWVNSKLCRKGSTDQGIWAIHSEDESAILKEKLATTKETSYAF